MVKDCERCENEAKVEGLPIGQKCLDGLRADLAGYDEILRASELDRLTTARDELTDRLGPDLERLEGLDKRIAEILDGQKDEVETAILGRENAELAAQLDRDEAAAEAKKLEATKLEVELLETQEEIDAGEQLLLEEEKLANAKLAVELEESGAAHTTDGDLLTSIGETKKKSARRSK